LSHRFLFYFTFLICNFYLPIFFKGIPLIATLSIHPLSNNFISIGFHICQKLYLDLTIA